MPSKTTTFQSRGFALQGCFKVLILNSKEKNYEPGKKLRGVSFECGRNRS